MKIILKLVILLSAILLVRGPVFAQKVGSTSMQFLHVMPCARATAMGDAYSVLATGAEAVFWNPSGTALLSSQEFSSTYIDWIFDTRQGALSYATPIGNLGAIGVQIQYIDFGEFEETSNDPQYMVPGNWGLTGRTFHPFGILAGLTYARSLTDKFAAGVSVKYGHESLFNEHGATAYVSSVGGFETVKTWTNALLFDFGIRYNTGFHSLQVAASVQNFGPDLKYASESNPAPMLFRYGIATDLIGKDGFLLDQPDNRLTVAFDLFQPNDYAQQSHLGGEYEFQGVFAIRAGYKFNYDYEGLTLGAGFKQPVGSVKLSVDYSYGSMGTYLGYVQRISLGAILP